MSALSLSIVLLAGCSGIDAPAPEEHLPSTVLQDPSEEAPPAEDAPTVTVGELIFQGVEACTKEHVSVDIQVAPDGLSLEIDYGPLEHQMLEAGDSRTATCNIAVPFDVSPGYTVVPGGATVEGAAWVPSGAHATISSRVQLNAGAQLKARKRVDGPFNGEISLTVPNDDELPSLDAEAPPVCRDTHVLSFNARLLVSAVDTTVELRAVKSLALSLVPCVPRED
jgi:hypothetical protein